jgi:hypothetical protein
VRGTRPVHPSKQTEFPHLNAFFLFAATPPIKVQAKIKIEPDARADKGWSLATSVPNRVVLSRCNTDMESDADLLLGFNQSSTPLQSVS